MKAVFIIVLVLNCVFVDGIPISPGNNQTCSRKQAIKDYCSNINKDMGALFSMVNATTKKQSYTKGKNMFSSFSTVKKLGKEKIIERLFLFHNILGNGSAYFGIKISEEVMKIKTINIVIQIKALAEILQNDTNCNPGNSGNEFKFDVPPNKSLSANNYGFFYHFAALLRQMQPDFNKNVAQQLNNVMYI